MQNPVPKLIVFFLFFVFFKFYFVLKFAIIVAVTIASSTVALKPRGLYICEKFSGKFRMLFSPS